MQYYIGVNEQMNITVHHESGFKEGMSSPKLNSQTGQKKSSQRDTLVDIISLVIFLFIITTILIPFLSLLDVMFSNLESIILKMGISGFWTIVS